MASDPRAIILFEILSVPKQEIGATCVLCLLSEVRRLNPFHLAFQAKGRIVVVPGRSLL